jgi:hypothetical protein
MGCGKMKSGGTIKKVKKMVLGGSATNKLNKPKAATKPTKGNSNVKMGIYGVPNAGPTGPNIQGVNTMKVGGATDEKCWPGKPGCGHSRANRVNKRRSAANKAAPVVKKILGAGAGAAIGAYAKNIGGIKDKIQALKQEKMGGTTRKMKSGGKTTKSLKRFQGDVTGSQVVTPPANTPRPRLSDMSAFAVDQNQDMNVGDKGVMNREAMAGSFNSNPKRKPKQIMAGSMDGYQKKGGSVKKMSKGGALKPVPAGKVGLSKLPTPVRNKMGYMKKGGSKKK